MKDIRPCCEDQNHNCHKHNSLPEKYIIDINLLSEHEKDYYHQIKIQAYQEALDFITETIESWKRKYKEH